MLPPFQGLAREASALARGFVWPYLQVGLALLIGVAGGGFLLWAAFYGLWHLFGPGPAGLILGGLLVGLALLLIWKPLGLSAYTAHEPPPPPASDAEPGEDVARVAAFTAAFVLGRYVADRTRD